MPSADAAPSLLSRLSPAPPYPSVSRSSPSRELPPHLQHALDNEALAARSPSSSSSAGFPASPPKPSSLLSSSPPKPSTSPRKGTALRSPQPGAHLTPLPDDVLLKKTQPIPAARSTRSSRWAASPPASPALGSSPQAVFGSASSARSIMTMAAGSPPAAAPATTMGSSPGSRAGFSPPKASPALDQIESMLAQLRATPSSSPPKVSTSPPKPSSSLPRHSPLLAGAAPLPSVPAAASGNKSAPAPAPASSSPAKKKVLGGRSKWARADDDEPDEFASVKEKEQVEANKSGAAAAGKTDPPAPPVPVVAPAASTAAAEPASAPSAPTAVSPAAAAPNPTPSQRSPPVAPAVSTIRSETANASLSWADDDDDELPDLDDWGIPASSLPPPNFAHEDEPAPAASLPPAQPQPALPPLGARRRSHSNASGGGGGNKHNHGHGHGHARSPPHVARSPPTSPRAVAPAAPPHPHHPHHPPPKAPSRLFANAARAAASGAGAGARELPPHVVSPAAQGAASPQQQHKARERERMAPPGALFSRLSGLAPHPSGGGKGAAPPGSAPVAPAAAGGHGAGAGGGGGAGGAKAGRRSRGGKPRASLGGGAAGTGAGVGASPAPVHAPARFAPAPEGGSWRDRGGAGAASKWA
ncbi:hypothetical protein DMC30DRAFT_288317 [Rhodotorula diobovata]|uniref:Uncharacterized protein n=1 Tax=Rhodotorula diobovata TaxID=5288 RepID=A0A5C5FTW3_9BASI|nr:hypothetical protein DMC30DRAFT_288317 [Rhodotorula diobovata]